jgi:proline dehydrogenase
MYMLFVAGNSIRSALNVSKQQMLYNRRPIINYVKEVTNNEKKIYDEYLNLLNYINSDYKVAIKLSAFNFNEKLLNLLVTEYKSKNVDILIDAENSSNNRKYQEISNRLIINHNDKLNLIKTYQMYRKDSFLQLQDDMNIFKENNKKIGVKLVRGAYWNSERNNNQLFTNKKDTDYNYNNAIKFLDDIKGFKLLATHNYESINYGLIQKSDYKFAHLLDMNTNIYDSISKKREVYVYIPYGPYYSMIPYLMRRLYENIDMIKYMIK